MSNPFVSEIRIFSGNFAPSGWALCNGQLLPIAQNTALFSLLGTTYGGNGVSTFGLPDLRGRVPLQPGQGPGLTNRVLGEQLGEEGHTLTTAELPSHGHLMSASQQIGFDYKPANSAFGVTKQPAYYAGPNAANVTLGKAIAEPGTSDTHPNMQPFLALNFIIATQGIFPARG